MSKPRRKSEIRTNAQRQIAELRKSRGEVANSDWRLSVLNALIDGMSVSRAAIASGVKRSRIYDEQKNQAFDRAMRLARHYGDNRIKWVSRPIWPPSSETVQRHEPTFQRMKAAPRNNLVARGFWS